MAINYNVFQHQIPNGYPGVISRPQWSVNEQYLWNASFLPAAFGVPVIHDGSQKVRALALNGSAASTVGFAVRTYPQTPGYVQNFLFGGDAPTAERPADVLRMGYIIAGLYGTTAATAFGQVYARVRNVDASNPLGAIYATPGTLAVAATADADNVGNGTITVAATPTGAGVVEGRYTAVLTQVIAAGGKFIVYNPQQVFVGVATAGVLFDGPVRFTIADGATDWALGDAVYFDVQPDNSIVPGAVFYVGGPAGGNVEISYNIGV